MQNKSILLIFLGIVLLSFVLIAGCPQEGPESTGVTAKAVAGGIEPKSARYALEMGADIIIVGRFIASAKDVKNAMRRILNVLPGYSDIDLKRIHDEDDDASVKKATWDE